MSATASATVVPFPREPWVSKAQLATHLGASLRWIDYRISEGMPCERFVGLVRFKISEAEAWLRAEETVS